MPDRRFDFSVGGGMSFSLLPTIASYNATTSQVNSGGFQGQRGTQAVFQTLPQPLLFAEYRATRLLSFDLVYSQMRINRANYDLQRGVMDFKGQYVAHYPGVRMLVHLRPYAAIDPYLYGRVGYQIHQNPDLISEVGRRNALSISLSNTVHVQVGAGCRFFWRSSWAIFTELGIGRPNYFSLGIYYKL